MSSALAIAAVTAVLKDLLDNAMIDHSVSAGVGGPVAVTASAPDRVKVGAEEVPQLNLFLYGVTPNPGWRNVGLPSRDNGGQRVTNPPLALDLHYLLSAYAKQDCEAEILLGYAMLALHETPVISRDAIRTTLALPSPVDGGILPPALGALSASDLADQVEQIKVTPQSMSTEEISRLWTAFQASYRPSIAYHASVVLLDSTRPTRSALPVLTRGRPDVITGRDQGVIVQPSLLPPFPTLHEVIPPSRQTAVRMGELLRLGGHHLDGDGVVARFAHPRVADGLELPAGSGATATAFQVQIPPDPPLAPVAAGSPLNPENWPAGIYTVVGVVKRAGQPDRSTNVLPVALAPRITSISVGVASGVATLTVSCSPKAWKGQQVRLVIGERELSAQPFASPKTETLTFAASGLPAGAQPLRLRVDAVESILVDRAGPVPAFEPSQQVTIP